MRFKLHLLLYGRVQTFWTLLTSVLCILAPALVFANLGAGLVMAGALAVWLLLQLGGALLVRNFRKKVSAETRARFDQLTGRATCLL